MLTDPENKKNEMRVRMFTPSDAVEDVYYITRWLKEGSLPKDLVSQKTGIRLSTTSDKGTRYAY